MIILPTLERTSPHANKSHWGEKGGCLRRQFKREHGTLAQLANHANGAAVRLNDDLSNRKSHASSMRGILLVAPTIELLENQRLLEAVDPWALVGNADNHPISAPLGSDAYRSTLW